MIEQLSPNLDTPVAAPEVYPGVSMDAKLVERLQPGQVINFNYEKFSSQAQKRGASSEDIASAHIDIVDPSYRGEGETGNFYPAEDGRPPIVEVIFKSNQQKMDQVLGHEFEHHLQVQKGEAVSGTFSEGSYDAGVKEVLKGKKRALIFGAGALVTAAAVTLGADVAAIPGIAAMTHSVSQTALVGGYKGHWSERAARKAEKQFKNSGVVRIDTN